MKVSTILYFVSGAGFVLIGSSIVPVSGVSSAIVGGIILAVGAFIIWAGYREYKNLKKQVNAWPPIVNDIFSAEIFGIFF